MLILTAIHFPQPTLRIALVFVRKLVHALLCLNYFQAALVCEALDDFRAGPGILNGDPQVIHQRLLAEQKTLGPRPMTRTTATPAAQRVPAPASWLGKLGRLFACVWKQLLSPGPTCGAPVTHVIAWEDAGWWSLGAAETVGVSDPCSDKILVYSRSRRTVGRLLLRGLQSLGWLFLRHRRVRKKWRAAFPRLTSAAFWNRYLGLAEETTEPRVPDRMAA